MPDNFKGYCKTCALAGLNAPRVCALSGQNKQPEDYCDEHRQTLTRCSICGQIILQKAIIDDNHFICGNCFSLIKTCKTCRNGDLCDFMTNPSQIPPMIEKQVRKGNMTAVTQVMNPERIRITCEKGCKCYSKENGCLKQISGTCGNQEVLYND